MRSLPAAHRFARSYIIHLGQTIPNPYQQLRGPPPPSTTQRLRNPNKQKPEHPSNQPHQKPIGHISESQGKHHDRVRKGEQNNGENKSVPPGHHKTYFCNGVDGPGTGGVLSRVPDAQAWKLRVRMWLSRMKWAMCVLKGMSGWASVKRPQR